MKTLLSCDQVFEILTREPFPSGQEHDEAVERHLQCCHECRSFAEALEPAVVELFRERLPLEESARLPQYLGQLVHLDDAPAAWLADFAQSRKEEARRQAQQTVLLAMGARLAAAVLLVASLCLLLWQIGDARGKAGGAPLAAERNERGLAEPTAAGRQTLLALGLPLACVELLPEPPQPRFACCTRCHAAGQPEPAAGRVMAALQRSCGACHDS